METTKTIGQFELVDHGIEHSQYFQGCGVTFTEFEHVVTGIGDNPAEAIDDCLGQIAWGSDFETEGMETRIMEQEGWESLPTVPAILSAAGETHYHVSIRWNEEG